MKLSVFQETWRRDFESIAQLLSPALVGTSATIVHIGSTSIPGSISKPIIDIDVVARTTEESDNLLRGLESIGYVHRGDLGISGREAFFHPPHLAYHHLYLVQENSGAYRDHVDFKSALIASPQLLAEYNSLKRGLEYLLSSDRAAYTEGKREFIEKVLFDYRRQLNTLKESNLKDIGGR